MLRPLRSLGVIAVVTTLTLGGCSRANEHGTASHPPKKQSDQIVHWIRTAVVGEMKAKSDSGHERIQALESPSPGAYVVALAGDTKSTVYSEEDLLRAHSAELIGRIFGYATDDETPAQLTLIWMLPGPDGGMQPVMKIEISRTSAKRWIWSRVYPPDFPDSVDKYEYASLL